MEEELQKKLKAGIEQEIQNYESMLKISRSEQEILKKEAYSRELIDLASNKLQLMNHIHQIGLMLAPLKVMWLKEREKKDKSPPDNEIGPLVSQLGAVLEDLLEVDRANTRKLAALTGSLPEESEDTGENPGPTDVAQAYQEFSAR